MRRLYPGGIFHLVRSREDHHIPSTVIGITMRNEVPKLRAAPFLPQDQPECG